MILFFAILAGIVEAVTDKLNFHFDSSIFVKFKNQQWWNPELSWKNKHKEGSKFKKWLWKTVFVFLTDAWHFFKAAHTLILFVFVLYAQMQTVNTALFIVFVLGGYIVKKAVFEITFNKILSQK